MGFGVWIYPSSVKISWWRPWVWIQNVGRKRRTRWKDMEVEQDGMGRNAGTTEEENKCCCCLLGVMGARRRGQFAPRENKCYIYVYIYWGWLVNCGNLICCGIYHENDDICTRVVSDRIPPVVYWKKINDVNNRGYKRQPSNKITKIIDRYETKIHLTCGRWHTIHTYRWRCSWKRTGFRIIHASYVRVYNVIVLVRFR